MTPPQRRNISPARGPRTPTSSPSAIGLELSPGTLEMLDRFTRFPKRNRRFPSSETAFQIWCIGQSAPCIDSAELKAPGSQLRKYPARPPKSENPVVPTDGEAPPPYGSWEIAPPPTTSLRRRPAGPGLNYSDISSVDEGRAITVRPWRLTPQPATSKAVERQGRAQELTEADLRPSTSAAAQRRVETPIETEPKPAPSTETSADHGCRTTRLEGVDSEPAGTPGLGSVHRRPSVCQRRYHFGPTVRTVTTVRSWSVPVCPWRASLPSPTTAVTVCTVVVIGVGERNHGLQQHSHFGSTVRTVTIVRSWSVPVCPWRASLPSPTTAVTVCTVVVTGVGERNHRLQQRNHFGSTVRTVTTSLGERGHSLQPRPLRFYGLHRDRSEIVVCTRAPAAPARTVIPAVSLSGTFRFPVVPMVRTMAHEDS
ncbi:hypothetical protein ACLKA6_012650 [Drosophila palustris]